MCGEKLEQTGDGPFDTWNLPSCIGKILWLQALKYPCGVCSPHSHRELPGHWTSKKKQSALEQEHQGSREHRPGERGLGLGQAPAALLLGRSHFTFESVITYRFGSFGQLLPNSFKRCPCSTAWALFWQPPCPKLLTDCSLPCFQG